MSASLVGSEMCIRDRSHTGRRPVGDDALTQSVQRQECLILTREPLLEPCLLYTSDAADDM
eukprot:12062954-Alexandrium_andersonii.AAC.1